MKKVLLGFLLMVLLVQVSTAQYRTERSGYEGDNFSLEGALELFKESRTLRDFERKLNTQDRWVNNLDLDFDGRADYIRVEHRRQGDFQVIILQALVSRYEVQDVAVIEIERTGRQESVLQIIGDEDLYGESIIVEPISGYANSRRGTNSDYGDYVNVYFWPSVQYIYGQNYQIYTSPYRWQRYPTWWNAWRPSPWDIYRPRIVIYHRPYRIVTRHRVIRVHRFYRPYRSYCNTVLTRSNRVRVRQGRRPVYQPRVNARNQRGNYYGGKEPYQYGNRAIVSDRRGEGRINANSTDRRNPSRDRVGSYDGGRKSQYGNNRSIASDRRTPGRINNTPAKRNNSVRNQNDRLNPSSRTTQPRVGSRPDVRSPQRSTERNRTAPRIERAPTRKESPRVSTPSRNQEVRRTPERSVRSKSNSSSSVRRSPAARNSSRVNTPSRNQEVRRTPERSVRSKPNSSSSVRRSPAPRTNSRVNAPSRSSSKINRASTRQAQSRSSTSARRAPSKAGSAPRASQGRKSASSSRGSSSRRKNQ